MNNSGAKRGRRASVEAARDREWLRWIGRFRFVTAELLAWRFGVSVQQANARVRRLAAAGLVRRSAGVVGQAYAVALTRAGARAVGLPERRAPRTDAQREHELAIVRAVGQLERQIEAGDDIRIFTERECRERQARGQGTYAVDVRITGGDREKRWPDVIVEQGQRRTALELEFAPKAPARLWRILEAYDGPLHAYTAALFFVTSPPVARRVARYIEHCHRRGLRHRPDRCRLAVEPWWGAPPDVKRAVAEAITNPGPLTKQERRRL